MYVGHMHTYLIIIKIMILLSVAFVENPRELLNTLKSKKALVLH